MEEHINIETLSDWKAALHKGASIDTLLGLKPTEIKNRNDKEKDKKAGTKTEEILSNLYVEVNGTSLPFQLCCPRLSTTADETTNEFLISPPSIPISQLCQPCFVGMKQYSEEILTKIIT
ncbi:uncharacterized protein [Antedon mediterranea]|uniref:uncharacterized protein n=1 Tax=Antedon mediterranea TaxID=105859 RepID=UPI003AF98251